MSWIPFQRKFSKGSAGGTSAGTSASMGNNIPTAAAAKDSDEFENQLGRLSAAEAATNKIKKDSKKLNEAISALNRIECKLTDDLSNSSLCQQFEPDLRALTEDWHTFNRQLTNCSDDLNINVQRIIVDPMKRLQVLIKEVRSVLKKRDHCNQEIANYTAKVAKLVDKEKTGPNLVQLEKAKQSLAAVEEEYRKYDSLLQQELQLFVDSRIDFFQPCLENFIRSEALFWCDTINALNSSPLLSAAQAERAPRWNEYTDKQEKLMGQLSGLSIVEGNS